MMNVENLIEMPLLRCLQAWRRHDVASLIANKDWEAVLELCELRDAFVAEKHAIYDISYAEAQKLLDWLRRSGWFCLDSERILTKIDASKATQAKIAEPNRPIGWAVGSGPIVKFRPKNEKTDKNSEVM